MEVAAFSDAAEGGDVETVQGMVEADPGLLSAVHIGFTALDRAACNGHLEVVRYLLDVRADVNGGGDDHGGPLRWAAEDGHTRVVELLLTRGRIRSSQITTATRLCMKRRIVATLMWWRCCWHTARGVSTA